MYSLGKWFHRSAPARRGLTPRKHSFRPRLEQLEDRWVLSSFRPAVTDYFTGGFNQLQVWDTGSDGHLYNRYYDQGVWQWADHGTDGVPFSGAPAVTVYDDPVTSTHQLQLWVVGSDGHMYNHYYDGTWKWADHGTDGVSLSGTAAVTVYDDPATGQHQLQVWVVGNDGHLYNHYYDGMGTWSWADHGTGGSSLTDPAVAVYDDPFTGQHQLQVWAAGNDGNLYNRYYDGMGTWSWANHGLDGVGLDAPAVTVYDDPFTGQHQLQVWANGGPVSGNLYNRYYDGNGNWNWADHGTGGSPISDPAITVYDDPASGQHQLQVWATGSNGDLYNRYYDGMGTWNWADHGTGGAPVLSDPAVWVYDDPVSGTHQLQLWAIGNDNNWYNRYYDASSWNWANHGDPGVGFTPPRGGDPSPEVQTANPESALSMQGKQVMPSSPAELGKTDLAASSSAKSRHAKDFFFADQAREGVFRVLEFA